MHMFSRNKLMEKIFKNVLSFHLIKVLKKLKIKKQKSIIMKRFLVFSDLGIKI